MSLCHSLGQLCNNLWWGYSPLTLVSNHIMTFASFNVIEFCGLFFYSLMCFVLHNNYFNSLISAFQLHLIELLWQTLIYSKFGGYRSYPRSDKMLTGGENNLRCLESNITSSAALVPWLENRFINIPFEISSKGKKSFYIMMLLIFIWFLPALTFHFILFYILYLYFIYLFLFIYRKRKKKSWNHRLWS